MIDNIILVITGTLHNRSSEELIEKCHPLGLFESMVRRARPSVAPRLRTSAMARCRLRARRCREP